MTRPINFELIEGYWLDLIDDKQALLIKEYDMPPMFVYGVCLLDLEGRFVPIGIAGSLEEAKAKMQEYSNDFYMLNNLN